MRYSSRKQRRRSTRQRAALIAIVVAVGGGSAWWMWGRGDSESEQQPGVVESDAQAALDATSDVRNGASDYQPDPVHEEVLLPAENDVDETPIFATPDEAAEGVADDHDIARAGNASIDAARQLLDGGQVLEARQRLNVLLERRLTERETDAVRALLRRVADDTIFSKQITDGDPLVETYVVATGDVLVNIGRKFDVPAEALMLINGISDPRRIRVNQRLKVPLGPFNARISKSQFRLDVYLRDTYLRSYPVGLGLNNGTPEGKWQVKDRLENPTYYPPASAEEKRIIPPDDPENPLGEHWIGLEGIDGGAVGHEGYGIHGTIEPDSIGQAVSMGCVRMRNEDVAIVYKLLMPGRSKVTIVP